MKVEAYVGVSGVAHAREQEEIRIIAEEHVADADRFVMVGVQATEKTQLLGVENKYGKDWHPVGEDIRQAGIVDESGLTRPFVHCFFDDPEKLERGLEVVMGRTSEYARGVQLNVLPWMSEDYTDPLERFKEQHPDIAIVLQAHRGILEKHTPQQIVTRLRDMPVDYVLFDASMGQGKELDREGVQRFVDAVYEARLPVGVVVAGGLEAYNVERLFGPLVQEYDDLSCDAEGRLREGEQGRTVLRLQSVGSYLAAWKKTIKTR